MKTLNVVGCGDVGKALSRVWTRQGVFKIQHILNRSLASAEQAVEFVGAGRAVASLRQMAPADLVMISAGDESIEGCCRDLCQAGVLREGAILFHCSGSLPSTLLAPARARGARIAAIHPVTSFADPAAAAQAFRGTFCAIEGDSDACEVLRDGLERCGALVFPVDPQSKTVYHAGTVFVCNYLVALLEVGWRCLERAGIPRETAAAIMRPIVAGTVDNVFRFGPIRSLTGPIARGEVSVVARQCEALGRWDETIHGVYTALGRVALELSAAQRSAGPEALAAIGKLLG